MSAGRIYDKIGDSAFAKVKIITERGIICKITKKSLLETQIVYSEKCEDKVMEE